MHVALSWSPEGVPAVILADDGTVHEETLLPHDGWIEWAREREADHPRWVWSDTSRWYPPLLAGGVRVERCVDLRLCRVILRNATSAVGSALASAARDSWDDPGDRRALGATSSDALFELDAPAPDDDPVPEFARQRAAVAGSSSPGRLALLLAAESVGSLVAAELEFVGLPWRADDHAQILERLLGPRPVGGARPARMEEKLAEVRALLDAPDLNPDSPVELLKGLQRAGLQVASTRSWELKEIEHPAIEPLLDYKKLARLASANGWNWLDEWVRDGRFRAVYVPGGVVSGRWAAAGGGALQLPKQVRGAVVADSGWKLVVADAAQLEPRVLAAMAGDSAMARAGQAHDMYQGMVESGAVETRNQAKYGMLGAIYGGTTGESGRMRPRITRAFPRAMEFVEAAARAGERGESVSTWLGRSSPRPAGMDGTGAGYDETRTDAELRRARNDGAAWGRFTRNFVVQGTAAEWALCWMGGLRRRLWELGGGDASGAALAERPHLAFFLHDELVVHAPADQADAVAEALRESAAEAGRLLFGAAPVEFALSVAIVDRYADAK